MKMSWRRRFTPGKFIVAAALALLPALVLTGAAQAQLVSLKTVPVPQPTNLGDFVKLDAQGNPVPEAIQLGKALFWDMQVGSDGIQACASCHFHAGADSRATNNLSPGLLGGDQTFDLHRRPNGTAVTSDFPFHRLANPDDRGTGGVDPNDPAVVSSINDVFSSQGVSFSEFIDIAPGGSEDRSRSLLDFAFTRSHRNTRRVEPRNTPSVINAVFNFANFLDGRANHFFNGVNPFGPQDVDAFVITVGQGGALASEQVLLDNSSLASQAVGPPLSDFEMSAANRTFPKIGKKMLSLTPLGKQVVHPSDSVLGPLANSGQTPGARGLNTTYADLIRASFQERFWNSDRIVVFDLDTVHVHEGNQIDPRNFVVNPGGFAVLDPHEGLTTDEFSLMEANFSLIFGLAVQMYEATLVSDDAPIDRFLEGVLRDTNGDGVGDTPWLTPRQQSGLGTFLSGGAACFECHIGAEFTGASITQTTFPGEPGLIETMPMGDNQPALYDIGFYNIGVTPTDDDVGRGGGDPFGNPLAFSRQRAILDGNIPGSLTFDAAFVPTPGCVPDLFIDPPVICPVDQTAVSRTAVFGAFKTPNLRNAELTGPFFHNGGMMTLKQVVDFYTRGGNFREANIADLDPGIGVIGQLQGADDKKDELVDFLLSLTDERVREEMTPFDHPQIFVPNGHSNFRSGPPKRHRGEAMPTNLLEVPAVGAGGRPAEGLPPLKPFLMPDGIDPFAWHSQR